MMSFDAVQWMLKGEINQQEEQDSEGGPCWELQEWAGP